MALQVGVGAGKTYKELVAIAGRLRLGRLGRVDQSHILQSRVVIHGPATRELEEHPLRRTPRIGGGSRAAASQHGQKSTERDKAGGSKAAAAGPRVPAGYAGMQWAQVPQGYDNASIKDAAGPHFFLSVS